MRDYVLSGVELAELRRAAEEVGVELLTGFVGRKCWPGGEPCIGVRDVWDMTPFVRALREGLGQYLVWGSFMDVVGPSATTYWPHIHAEL